MPILARFQEQLQSIHGISIDAKVEDYLVRTEQLPALGASSARAPEQVLVMEEHGELHLGLYVDPAILAQLALRPPPLSLLLGKLLPSYCVAAEGVSHWLYLAHRAGQDAQVSQLELEVQAEVDKFASCALSLWQLGLTRLVRTLRERLFEGVRYFTHLSTEERERYATANHLANQYARTLERRYLAPRDRDGLLRELRASFRMSGGEKYARLAFAG